MVEGTIREKLLFAALLVAFAVGVMVAASIWEGGWGVDSDIPVEDISVDIQDEVSSA
jgi:hypothetical protein